MRMSARWRPEPWPLLRLMNQEMPIDAWKNAGRGVRRLHAQNKDGGPIAVWRDGGLRINGFDPILFLESRVIYCVHGRRLLSRVDPIF